MNPNEIKKALECCSKSNTSGNYCEGCPYNNINVRYCASEISKDTLAYINKLEAEKGNLKYTLLGVMHFVDKWLDGNELKQDEVNRADTMRHKTLQIIEEQQAKIDRLETVLSEKLFCITQLKGENFALTNERDAYKNLLKNAKTEAVKEFAERLKPKLYCGHIAMDDCINANINNLVKEMAGD